MDVFELRAAVCEEQIERMVSEFYARARVDEQLGPIFLAAVPDERWPAHIEKITRFWSTALRGTGRYRANPIEGHRAIEGLTGEHFARWLELFRATVDDVFAPELAGTIYSRASRMARHMEHVLVGEGEQEL